MKRGIHHEYLSFFNCLCVCSRMYTYILKEGDKSLESIWLNQRYIRLGKLLQMSGVEEIPKGRDPNLYFSSLYHQNPSGNIGRNNNRGISGSSQIKDNNSGNRGSLIGENGNGGNEGRQSSSKRKRVNYNIQQIQAEQFLTARPKSKSISQEFEDEVIDLVGDKDKDARKSNISVAELRKAARRFDELNRENYNENVRIEIPKNITGLIVKRNSNAGAVVKRLLISKKTWTNFVDELNKSEMKLVSNGNSPLEVKPNALQLEKLCTICGGVSYSSCIKCSTRVCSIKCQHIHDETRCTHF